MPSVLSKFHDAPRDGAHRLPRLHEDGACYYNARENLHSCWRHYRLHIVYGSIGLGGWFEYGGKDWGVPEFSRRPADSHAWLEDSDGNIYDCIQPSWADVAEFNGARVTWPRRLAWLEGMSKANAQKLGLTYIPAPAAAQAVIKAYADKAIAAILREKAMVEAAAIFTRL
jgi:hypothetical protein